MFALKHRSRRAILRIALSTGETVSPVELAEETGEALSNVGYNVRVLVRTGALTLVGTQQIRGSLKHFYRVGPLVEEHRALVDSILGSNADD